MSLERLFLKLKSTQSSLDTKNDAIEIFQSSDPKFKDGGQSRDFIHVNDVCSVIYHCIRADDLGGIYNVGTGTAASFADMAKYVLMTKKLDINNSDYIKFIDMPEGLEKQYQFFTKADIDSLRNKLGYKEKFIKIKKGIKKTWEVINE
jgi:ADP-L-glycero-D-manno-heptose 6-epimerase